MQGRGVLRFMAKLKVMACQAMLIILPHQLKMVMADLGLCRRP